MKKLKFTEHAPEKNLVRLDLGTGKGAKKPDGFIGVDINKWEGVQAVDLRKPWPWKSGTVDEVNADYLIQYLTASERVHFANELYRVLKPGGKAVIIAPHWCASRAYGDLQAHYPPVSEMFFATLNKAWRDAQNRVDTSGLRCDFDHTLGYGLHPQIIPRSVEYQQNAITYWKEAAQDIYATLTKR